jgi:hypothetical protein
VDPEIETVNPFAAPTEAQKGKSVINDNLTAFVRIHGTDVQLTRPVNLPIFMPSKAAPKPTLRSIIVGPATPSDPKDPLITVVPSILKHVLYFFSISPPSNFLINLNIIHINEDTIIPSYFCDNELLIHLAFITFPQLGDDALKKLALDYMDEDVNEEENIETENAEQRGLLKMTMISWLMRTKSRRRLCGLLTVMLMWKSLSLLQLSS